MKNKPLKIVFAGGGTGGHIFPLIAVARELKKEANVELIFIGPRNPHNSKLKIEGINIKNLITGKIRRYFSIKNIPDALKTLFGFFQAYIYLVQIRPDIIFSKGGYGSFPTVMVARLFGIPIILHESDSKAGMTNTILAKFARVVVVSFPGSYPEFPSEKTEYLGNPVRNMSGGSAAKVREKYNVKSNKKTVLVLGGSQGATPINSLIFATLKELTNRYEIFHQTGEKHYSKIKKAGEDKLSKQEAASWHIQPFFEEEDLKNIFALSDIVISRAGAGSIYEIASAGKPSIILPLESSAGGHQEKNAQTYQNAGACITLSTSNLSTNIFLQEIKKLTDNTEKLEEMSKAAQRFATPQSAFKIAEVILKNIK